MNWPMFLIGFGGGIIVGLILYALYKHWEYKHHLKQLEQYEGWINPMEVSSGGIFLEQLEEEEDVRDNNIRDDRSGD